MAVLLLMTSGWFSKAAWALPSSTAVSQAQHTVWRLSDSAPSNVADIAQTSDGFLWLGSPQGLVRFDGENFYTLPTAVGQAATKWDVTGLTAAPGNALWVATRRDGVALLRDGSVVRRFGPAEGLPRSTVYSLRPAVDGTMWAATSAGVFALSGSTWRRIWPAQGQPDLPAANLLRDRSGQLCFTTDSAVLCKAADAQTFAQRFAGAVEDLAVAPDGAFWIWVSGAGMSPLDAAGKPRPVIQTGIPHGHMMFGASGDLWVVTYGHGLNRFATSTAGPVHEVFDRADGLQSGFLHSIFEDREGSLWVGSTKGLERFRNSKITAVPSLGESPSTVLLADGADVWAGVRTQALQRVTADNRIGPVDHAPADITAALRDTDGSAWFGSSPLLWHEQHGTFSQLRLPEVVQGSSDVQAIGRDGTGALWVSVVRFGVFRYAKDRWTQFDRSGGSPTEYALAFAQDAAGRFWISYHGRLLALQNDAIRSFDTARIGTGDVQVLSADGSVLWAGGQRGLALFRGGEWHTVHTDHDDSLTGVAGLVRSADGALWVHSLSAVVRIAAEDVETLRTGDRRVPVKIFSFGDGLPGMAPQIRPLPSMTLAADGRIWLSTTSGVGWIDPAHLPVNGMAPTVSIQTMQADGRVYLVQGSQALPPHPRNLAIGYTAPSLGMEHGNRYRYRLIGFDSEWQDGGTRQTAYFTRLAPGPYEFEVEAVNEDGVASLAPAVLSFRIAPAFYQTLWFRALAWVGAAVLLWAVYRIRLQLATERIRHLLAERLSERERIARELHDTLLQGVQGLILLFQGIALQMSPESPLTSKMDQALDRAERLMNEGRDSVRDLRTSSLELSSALRGLIHEQTIGDASYSLEVRGQPRELQLLISDEVFKIAREAVLNAFQHAGATWVKATLAYDARSFDLSVEDDGKGISPEFAKHGRRGHWGLIGMRDRAQKMEGELDIKPRNEGSGTLVRLTIPGRVAYRYAGVFASRWLARSATKREA